MKGFTIKIAAFALLFLVYDKLFIIVREASAENEVDKRLEYIINGKINKDLIIAGSSRGSRDILASQIEDQTGLTAYNLCYPGSDVEFHEFIIEALVTFNRIPKIILLVIDDPEELQPCKSISFRKDRLYPLVKYEYVRDKLISLGDKDKFLSKLLVLHQLNKYNFDLRKKKFTPADTIMTCGSMPISWQKEPHRWTYTLRGGTYQISADDSLKVLAYRRIIDICDSNSINLVIVFPPNYISHNEDLEYRIRQLSPGCNFYVYNRNNPTYQLTEYYYDPVHLMRNGAVEFTQELTNYLRDTLKIYTTL